jgi:hypothetical protein
MTHLLRYLHFNLPRGNMSARKAVPRYCPDAINYSRVSLPLKNALVSFPRSRGLTWSLPWPAAWVVLGPCCSLPRVRRLVLSVVLHCGHPCHPLPSLVFIGTRCPCCSCCPRLVLVLVLVPVLVVSSLSLSSPHLPHRPHLLVLVVLTVPWALAVLPVCCSSLVLSTAAVVPVPVLGLCLQRAATLLSPSYHPCLGRRSLPVVIVVLFGEAGRLVGVVDGLWLVLTWCRRRCSPLQSAGILVFAVSFAIAVLCVCHS